MLLKWIICTVPDEKQNEFSAAQCKWTVIKTASGFIAQFGGWDSRSGVACILALWQNQAAYENFMTRIHDSVFTSTGQSMTCTSVSTTLFNCQLEIDGNAESVQAAVENVQFVRIADCVLTPDCVDSFCIKQTKVWNPAMKQSNGMLGGAFGKAMNEPHRYIVSTLWSSKEAHSRYVAEELLRLRQSANPEEDLQQIVGYEFALEPSWTVQV